MMRLVSLSLAISVLLGQCHGFQLSPSAVTIQPRSSSSSLAASVAEHSMDAPVMKQQQQQTPPDMQAYSNGFKTVFTEVSCSLSTPTQGTLPPDLIGTYYKCGPAMFSAGSLPPPKNSLVKPKQPPVPDGEDMSRMVLHPFEGDGAVLAMTFHGYDKAESADNVEEGTEIVDTKGKVTTRFRYVRTNAFTNERKKGKKLYTGMESTRTNDNGSSVGNDLLLPFYRHHLLNGLNKMRKNTSNTRAVYFGKRLLTLWSGGLPYKLDSLALSTDGRSQLGGIIKREEIAMSSSAVIDSNRNRILFYGIDEEANGSALNIYEFNSKFQPIKENEGTVQVKLPGLALVYDFGVTENYCVFIQPQLKVNGMQYMLNKEPGKSATLEPQSSVSFSYFFYIIVINNDVETTQIFLTNYYTVCALLSFYTSLLGQETKALVE